MQFQKIYQQGSRNVADFGYFFANIKNLDKNAPSRFLDCTNGAKSRKTSHKGFDQKSRNWEGPHLLSSKTLILNFFKVICYNALNLVE